jgi:hypothetical protein
MKRGKEITIESNSNYTVYSGPIDNKKAKTIYLNISSWGNPIKDTSLNYERVIKNLRKSVLQHTYNILCESNFKESNTIVDLDMRSSGVRYGKKSFMSCELTLFQKNYNQVNSDIVVESMKDISKSIIENVLDTNEHFIFGKTK